MAVEIVVAMAQNGVIGRDGGMPWRLSTDLKRFKAITMGKPVIMGRKTFESIGKPLAGRYNIVVTRDEDWRADGVETVHTLEGGFALAKTWLTKNGATDICVVGGGEIYRQALPQADRLWVTHVLAEIDGDTVFPPIDPLIWRATDVQDVPAGEKDSFPTRQILYERSDD